MLVPSGTRVTARHIGMLATAAIPKVPVVRQPHVCLLLAEPMRSQRHRDSNGPMIHAAAERDGGVIVDLGAVGGNQSALPAPLAATEADIALVVGGTGRQPGEHPAPALAGAGGVSRPG